MRRAHILPGETVNGTPFGSSEREVLEDLAHRGGVGERRHNVDGELELVCDGAIYRVRDNCFVECTFPAWGESGYRAVVGGVDVLNVFDWLAAQPDVIEIARFRISQEQGIAYDFRQPQHGSFTVFQRGHWAGLLAGL
ncbi:MAG: hypothetical protein AAF515_12305 [Pseudomonadota bacterium]